MLAPERHQRILSILSRSGAAGVSQLAAELDVSAMTIRRDLATLEEQGLLARTHGGAILAGKNPSQEIPYTSKAGRQAAEKERIGRRAAALISEGDAIILDSGSTTLQIAKHIEASPLMVVTNDVAIAYTLGLRPGVTVAMPGGIMQPSLYTLLHPTTVQFISGLRVNKLFLAADAVHLENGVTNRTLDEVPVKQAMIRAAQEVILVADSSKFGKEVFARVCHLSSVHRLITDSACPPEMVDQLRAGGIQVELV